jgi:hypothetical protein
MNASLIRALAIITAHPALLVVALVEKKLRVCASISIL